MHTVVNVSGLRAAQGLAPDQPLYLQGHDARGDGGEGMFLCNPSDAV